MSQNKLTNRVPTEEMIWLEDETEDELLARALEESLRHYREVEIPLRQSQCLDRQNGIGKPGTSRDDDAFSSTMEHQVQTPSQPLLYKGKDAEGFDLAAGRTWIYPTNYPIRQYQYDIVNACLFRNTLVSLPTGLGKTFIAAVVMYNFYRWFPLGKVIFMAPTKPLVHQQIDSCYKVMGIPKEDTAELTGSMSPTERAVAWEKKRVFFLTPQVFTNDLTCGACAAASIKCLVVDEAHRALGNHSYCQVIKALLPFNDKFRVLALTATPGSNMQAVRQVVRNLMISHVELRKEESPDIAVFTHKRNMETVIVSLGTYLSSVRERFMLILDRHLVFLRMQKVLYGSMNTHTKFGILKARDMFRQNPPSSMPRGKTGIIEANFAVCITLLHALELISLYGLRSFLKFLQGVLNESRGTAVVHAYLKNENELQKLLDELRDKLGPDNQAEPDPDQSMAVPPSGQESAPYIYSHPKVEKLQDIVVGHFQSFQEKNVVTRAMIFCEYRDIADEVYHILQKHRPLVKPMTFVGQSSTGKQSKGFSQKQQLKVMRKFKAGGYNTLISTCVGEEGLDIGEVDLIVCFDAHKSPIRLVQRIGRTGRQREGRIVMLVTEGREHAKFKASMYQNQAMSTKLLEKNHIAPYMYANNPRMIPQGTDPRCHRMFITVPTEVKEEESKKKQRQQDIRKLLGGPSGRKVTGQAGNEGSSPYCTEEELMEFWDGRTVPAFERLQDVEELHAKRGSDLCQVLNMDCITNKVDKSKILDLSKWLAWQQSLQPAVLVQHTDDSTMLVELLQYAVNKRCQMQPTQTAGLLSQANSLKWSKKRTKGKHVPKKKVKSSTSAPKLGGKKDPEVNEQFKNMPVVDAESIPASYNLQHQPSVISLQIQAKGVDVESGEKLSDVEVLDHRETAVAEQKAVSPKKDLTDDGLCYFCKNGLFDCHNVISCITTIKRTRERSRHYRCLDLSIVYNFSEASVTAFDLRQLLSPVRSPVNDPDCEHACQLKSEKDSDIMKLNFDLDFSVFEQCLFEAEVLPQGPPDNVTHDVAVSKVVRELQVSEVGQNVEYCAVSVNDNKYRNSDLLAIESRNDSVELPGTKIKLPQQSHSIISPGRFSNVAITPPRGLHMETNHSHEKTPSNVLLSPVSPILGSMLKRHASESPVLGSVPNKHVPESPVLGAVPKNLSRSQSRLLPICSTPKIHKKNLFLGSIMLDATQECESGFTSVRAKGSKSLKTVTAGDCEQQLNSRVSEIQTPPRPNFDLFSAIQWPGNLEPNVENANSKDSLTNTTMFTVTQLLALVDKELNTAVDIEDSLLPHQPVKANQPVRTCSDIVPGTCSESHTIEHTAPKDNKYPDSVKPSNTSNITSVIRKSIDEVTSFSCSEQKSEHKLFDHDYLHDDADDIFANLSVECHMFSSKESTSSVTSAGCAIGNIPDVGTCLLGKSDKSEHCEFECEDDPAAIPPEITKLPISSIVDHSQLTTTVIKPLCSDLSLKHELTDFASNTCMGNSSVKTVRNISKTSFSADPKTVCFDNKNSPIIIRDEKQYTEVSTTVTEKQKEIRRYVDFQGQPDLFVSLAKESIATFIGSSSGSKTLVDDDSPVIKPLGRNRKRNISSTSNESGVSPPYHPQNRVIKHDRSKKCNSHLVQDSGWLTARRSNLNTSLEEDNGGNPQILLDMKKGNNIPSGKRCMESCIPIKESDVANISSDDDFESQSLMRWKKRSQSKGAGKTGRNGHQRKINPVNRKLKHGLRHCPFVESEAEESGSCLSDDDENNSDLDNYDSSFVNDSGNQTYTDIQAKFLHSVIQSAGDGQGQFKMPACKPAVPLEDVFSQEDADFETSYLEDSFCVVNEEPQSEMMEASALEVAEAVLEAESKWKRRKRKRMMCASDYGEGTSENCFKSDAFMSKKRRHRIVTLESSDSERDDVNNVRTIAVDKDQVQKQIVLPPPKIHTGGVNTNSGSVSATGSKETEFSCKKSVSCESVSAKETEAVTVGDDWDWNDWNFDHVELPSCDQLFVEKDNKKHQDVCDSETKPLDEKSVSTKQTETVTVSDGWDWNDWNFDEPELPSCDQFFVEKDDKKHTLISAGETEDSHSLSTCSMKLIPKAVRSLSAEFNKETIPTSLSGDRETRKLPLVEDDNSVLPPPDSSNAELPKEQRLKSYSTTVLEACSSSSKTIVMATRQVASAPEIATTLRAVHNINVLVRSVTEADYVISWQLGVLRVRMSDFIRTCPIKSGLAKAVRLLQSGFMKHVLVAENDKLVPVPTHRDACSKTTSTHVAYLRQAGIPVLYSCDKADTVRLLAMLTDLECSQNRGIVSLPKDVTTVVNRIQFYQSLPGVNIALAMRLCYIFSSVIDFLDRCSNVQKIQEVLGLDTEKAVRIQLVLHRVIKPQC